MTVPATPRRAGPYDGNGVTTSFTFSFKVFAKEDIGVYLVDVDGLETELVLDSDYSVTLNGDQDATPGGSITYPLSGDPLASGETLSVIGTLEYEQTLDLLGGGNFNPRNVEDAFDRVVIQIQQLAEETGRALRAPVSFDGDATLPSPEAGKVIGWDDTATALRNIDPATLASIVAYAAWDTDVFNGTGAQTAFVLSADPGSVHNCDVSISGVAQTPGVDFTVSGTTLTFTSAPPAGTGNVVVRFGQALPAGTANAQDVTFEPSGTGATDRSAQSKLREWVSVTDFGAVGDGTTDDYAAIQNAVNAARRVYFPQQSGAFYRCNSPIVLRQDTHLEGANKQNTVVKFFGCDGFTATSSGLGAYDIRIAGLSIIGDNTGTTKKGVFIDGTASNFGRVELENLVIATFSGDGVHLIKPIVSVLRLVQSSQNGVNGIYISGDGTSVHADTCYAASNGQDGWHIYLNVQYSTFTSCASDSNTRHGYFFNGTAANPAAGITMNSCGSETNGGDQFKFGGTLGLTLNSIFTFPGSPSAGGDYINLDGCRHVVLSGIRMDAAAPGGKYALNIGTLGGTQFPQNIRALGCSFSSVNDPNSAYDDSGEAPEAWVAPTLLNSWVNFGGSEATAAYYKDPHGVVHLKGTIKSGVIGNPAFNVPAAYRPSANRNYGTASNSLFGYLVVGLNGDVTPAAGSNTWFSLDGIYWRAGT